MTNVLLIIGAIIAATGTLPYMLSTIRRESRPQLVSWSVWTVLAGIIMISSYLEGEWVSAILSLEGFVSCAIIVVLGWRQGNFQLNKIDIVCLIGACMGIGSLVVLRDPFMALVVSVLVDAIAFVPTLIHGWNDPNEESFTCFATAVVSAGISLFVAVITHASVMGLIYPLYAVVFDGAMAIIILVGRMTVRADYRYRRDEV